MMFVMGLRFLWLLLLFGCTTRAPLPSTLDQLWKKVSMLGEGKARLEVPPESWVFSFEAVWKKPDWLMAITIPMHGEETFTFPGLDRPRAEMIPAETDFRFRIVQALREASSKRKLAYPQLGQDFVTYLHHVLRWAHADQLGLQRDCVAQSAVNWLCKGDGIASSWSWSETKEEFTGIFDLRPSWQMRVVFKNLTGPVFKRVTVEIERKTESTHVVELRQEFFYR